jgi:Icc-related predicted phosphoesterase
MKLLLFSDLHCDGAAARRLVERSHAADVVVGAGDFACVRRGIRTCLDVLRAIDRPAVLVPGNNESLDELVEACGGWPQAHVLHGSGVTLLGVPFYGLGGGVPVTPFGSWSFDFTEDEAAEMLRDCPAGAVLVSHSPPHGALDQASDGRSLGSTAVRDAVARERPRLVVCGHIHASAGRHTTVGDTPVVNAGPGGVEWQLACGAA